jgi:hypothetical protein
MPVFVIALMVKLHRLHRVAGAVYCSVVVHARGCTASLTWVQGTVLLCCDGYNRPYWFELLFELV